MVSSGRAKFFVRSSISARTGLSGLVVVGFSAHNEPSGWFDSLVELELLIDKYQRAQNGIANKGGQ